MPLSPTLRSCVDALADAIGRVGDVSLTRVALTREDAVVDIGLGCSVSVARTRPPEETDAAFADARTLVFNVLSTGTLSRTGHFTFSEPVQATVLIGRLNTLLAVSE